MQDSFRSRLGEPTALHELGQYVVHFQNLERLVNEVLIQAIDNIDRGVVEILVHELDFGKRVNTVDVLFSYVVRAHFPAQAEHIKSFHKLADDIVDLSKRRNELVHSSYSQWLDIEGREGLIRSNSKLKPSQSARIEIEEDLLPETFATDHKKVTEVIARLEKFRLMLIDWHYPEPT